MSINPQRLADARRRVGGLRAALQSRGHVIVGYPPSLIAEDLKLLGMSSLADVASRAGENQSVTRHDPPPATSNRNDQMNMQVVPRRAPASNIMRPAGKFASWPDFVRAVAKSSGPGGYRDPRLLAAGATSVTSANVGVDGGFAIPPEYLIEIHEAVRAEQNLLELCDQYFTETNTIEIPIDETTPWGNNGVQANWITEGQPITQSAVYLRNATMRLSKLEVLVPVTEEVASDALGLAVYLRRRAPAAIQNGINLALVQGSGAGTPLGVLNSSALVVVDAEGSQTAGTVIAANATKMFGRLPASSFATAVWLVHPDALPQLPAMNAAGANLFAWAPGMPYGAVGMLIGIPVIPHQCCSPLGAPGDLFLADFSQYFTALKIGGMRQEVSIHLWFDHDIHAFKFVLRVLGQPWLSAPIAPRVGTQTLSPFVTLAARA